MEAQSLTGGFQDSSKDSASAFRVALDVMARPGVISEISGAVPPKPLSVAAASVLLVLCDGETPIWLAPELRIDAVQDWLRFHTGAPLIEDKAKAMFAVGTWGALMPLDDFAFGTPEYPDRSVTCIVEMENLAAEGAMLRGPGIKDTAKLSLPEIKPLVDNAAMFPLGRDFFFCADTRIAALPRSTKIEV